MLSQRSETLGPYVLTGTPRRCYKTVEVLGRAMDGGDRAMDEMGKHSLAMNHENDTFTQKKNIHVRQSD